MIFRNHYNMWNIFVETMKHCISLYSKMNRKFKELHLFEIETFGKMINVFTVIFDQFNASLINKCINFLFMCVSL